jgi:serine/threonine protein phosphatase PrpC
MVDAAEIENLLRGRERSSDAADALLDSALGYGGKDNISAVVVDVARPRLKKRRR